MILEKNQTSTALVWFFSKCDYYQYVTISLKLTIRDAKGITMLQSRHIGNLGQTNVGVA